MMKIRQKLNRVSQSRVRFRTRMGDPVFLRRFALGAIAACCLFTLPVFYAVGGLIEELGPSEAALSAAADRLIPVYSVDTRGEKVCALSFDAAWGATRTESILDILDDAGIKATFFLTDIWMDEYPEMVKVIADRGHELALHSHSHPNLTQIDQRTLLEEIDKNRQRLKELTGIEAKAFRPPFGAYNNQVVRTLMDQGLLPVQWSADSLDWKELSAEEIVTKLKKDISPGGIVLFHNDGLHTPEALPALIGWLKEQGYSFKTVSDLAWPAPYTVNPQGVQKPAEEPGDGQSQDTGKGISQDQNEERGQAASPQTSQAA